VTGFEQKGREMIDLEALARQAKAFQRPRGVRSATDLLRLALAWEELTKSVMEFGAPPPCCGTTGSRT
jgi:hypothetical protein